MKGLGIHVLEPAEELGPQLGGVEVNDSKIGTIPFYALAFAIPAAGGAIAGASIARPGKRLGGAAIGALGGGIGGLATLLILRAVS